MAKKQEWERVNEADKRVEGLIVKFHPHLEECAVLCIGKPKAGSSNGRLQVTRASKASDLQKSLLKPHGEDVDYLIVIGLDVWEKLPDEEKDKRLDFALCHFMGKDSDENALIRAYEVQGFSDYLKRYGVDGDAELQQFVNVAKQLPLPGMMA